jgi:NCS1 family nucleobase:cation symporter-1
MLDESEASRPSYEGRMAVTPVSVFAGTRPTHQGNLVTESHGMAPIPEDQRYGSTRRNFTVWFAPNMELSSVFTGTLAFTLGLGF